MVQINLNWFIEDSKLKNYQVLLFGALVEIVMLVWLAIFLRVGVLL